VIALRFIRKNIKKKPFLMFFLKCRRHKHYVTSDGNRWKKLQNIQSQTTRIVRYELQARTSGG
ncbi:MAG: hypothetical protein U9Q83_04495, partial [Bacteroidota bacterium]|nr:hypothetical protein [Bacteroidota bacterium]